MTTPTNRDKLEETVYSHIEGAYHNGHFDARWGAKEDDEVQRFRVDQIMAEVEAYTNRKVREATGAHKVAAIKAIHAISGAGLRESKALYDEAQLRPPEGGTNG